METSISKNESLDLSQKDQRKQAIKFLFSWCSNKHLSLKLPYDCFCDDNKYLLMIMRYEMIKNCSALYRTISLLRKQFKQCRNLRNTKLINNFIHLCRILTSNRLTLKYIFETKQKIWKILLSTIIILLSNHVTVLKDTQLLDLMILFARTSLYWSHIHWLFVVENGLCTFVIHYIQKLSNDWMCHSKQDLEYCRDHYINGENLKRRSIKLEIPAATIILFIIDALKHDINKIKIWRKYKKCLYQQYKTLCKSEMEVQTLLEAQLYSHHIRLPQISVLWYQLHKLFAGDESYREGEKTLTKSDLERKVATPKSFCGWKFCAKTERKLYKCKKCRLVNYCCRNHQKKDWKHVHAQQCI
eukprot:254825_1